MGWSKESVGIISRWRRLMSSKPEMDVDKNKSNRFPDC